MIWLYRTLFLPGFLLALPYYGLRMWRRGGYGKLSLIHISEPTRPY